MKLIIELLLAGFSILMLCFILTKGINATNIASDTAQEMNVRTEATAQNLLNFERDSINGSKMVGSDAANYLVEWSEEVPVLLILTTNSFLYNQTSPYQIKEPGDCDYIKPDSVFVGVTVVNANDVIEERILVEDGAVVSGSTARELAVALNRDTKVGIATTSNGVRRSFTTTNSLTDSIVDTAIPLQSYKVKVYRSTNGLVVGVGFHGNNSTSFAVEFGGV